MFDCDGTLWSGDAGYGFMAWTLEQGLVSRSTNDWIDTRYRDYRAGNVSEEAMCGEMVQMYAGLRERSCAQPRPNMSTSLCASASLRRLLALVATLQEGRDRDLGSELDQSLGSRRGPARFRDSG